MTTTILTDLTPDLQKAKDELLSAILGGADTAEDATRLSELLHQYGGLGKIMTENIEGISLQIGDDVQVRGAADSTIDMRYVGVKGKVTGFIFDTGATFPTDMMVAVEFRDGKTDGFWVEELEFLEP